jgi:serine protease Do
MSQPVSTRSAKLVLCTVGVLTAAVLSSVANAQPQVTPQAPPVGVTPEARRVSDSYIAVAERVSPSVVEIDIAERDGADEGNGWKRGKSNGPVARGMGSGVIFSPDGAILTNNHVLEGALSINVRLRDGRYLPAQVVGRDPGTDLAMLRVEAIGLTPARFADSDVSRVGEAVVAIGSPFGFGYTVSAGVLSAKGRGGLGVNEIEDYLQTDASINPGNSGGPLCDLEGRVIGINTMLVGRGSGIGFAVPANAAKRVAEQLLRTGRVQRAWIGAGIQDLTPALAAAFKLEPRSGVLVSSVDVDSPAAKANMRAGDVIFSIAAKPMHDARELSRELFQLDVGRTLPLEIGRDGKRYGTSIVLAARTEAAIAPLPAQQERVPQTGLGLAVRDLTPEQAVAAGLPRKAVCVVATVAPGSIADRSGLQVGDAIAEADGAVEPTAAKVSDLGKDGELLIRAHRAERWFFAALRK